MIFSPTFYDDLFRVMKDYKGDVIASTACLGGSLPKEIYKAFCENPENPNLSNSKVWINKMVQVFGEGNFFLELQPSEQEQQIIVNKLLTSHPSFSL